MSDYTKTTWSERLRQFTNRIGLTPAAGGATVNYDVTQVEGTISQAGVAVSPTNLNNLETGVYNAHVEIDEAAGFNAPLEGDYQQNTMLIASCEADEGWANNFWDNTVGTVSVDTINFRVGSSGIKISTATDGGGHLTKALDLTKFTNGDASTTADYIEFDLFITAAEHAKLVASGVKLWFMNDAAPTVTNDLRYFLAKADITPDVQNHVKIPKSSFIADGTGSWGAIVGISLSISAPASACEYTVDAMRMTRKDPSTASPNTLQSAGARQFAIASGANYFLGAELNKLILRNISPATGITLLGTKAYTECFEYMRRKNKTVSYLGGICFYVDASNYIIGYINNDVLTLTSVVATVATTVTVAMTVAIGDRVEYGLRKTTYNVTTNPLNIELIAYKNGNRDIIYSRRVDFTPTTLGYLAAYEITDKYSNIEALSITTTEHADTCNLSEMSRNLINETWKKISSTTLSVAAASISLSGLAGFSKIKILIHARNDTADAAATMVLNGDTGANYTAGHARFTSTTNYDAPGATSNFPLGRTDSDWASTDYGFCEVTIYNTLAGIKKNIECRSWSENGLTLTYGSWDNVADLITSITITPEANNFDTGSRFDLWGCV